MNDKSAQVGQQNHIKVFEAMQQFVAEHHYAPSTRDLSEMTGIRSTSTINRHMVKLREEGLIDYEPAKPRTLRILV